MLAAACAAQARADEFFQAHVENMLTRSFYVPTPSDARLSDGADFSAAFSISNTVNAERRGDESLLVDGESDSLRLSVDGRLAPDWRYRLSVPVIHDGGGFLDQTIESWHSFFGFQQGNRPYYPKDQIRYDYRYTPGNNSPGAILVSVNQPGTRLGGLAAEAGWYAADSPAQTLSFWGGTQMPTGAVSRLTGDGAWDAALWGHWARRGSVWQIGVEAGVAEPFGDEIFGGRAHHAVAFARSAITRSLGSRWSVRAQLDGQTRRVDDSELRFLGPSLQLSLGAAYRLRNRWRVAFGFTEDAAVNTAPDVTFFLSVLAGAG
jgi:hypothetical protein